MKTFQTTTVTLLGLAALALLVAPAAAQDVLLDVEKSDGTDVLTVFSDGGLFAIGETFNGSIPIEGASARMMWYPAQAAFRAGATEGTGAWNDANIGLHSAAFGVGTEASGKRSMAWGFQSVASGDQATAMGGGTASGQGSTAIGPVSATGDQSTAIGSRATTNGHQGAFVYGDQSASPGTEIQATTANQFVVRAQHIWLGTDNGVSGESSNQFLTTSTGAHLTDGGAWTNASGRASKANFRTVDPGTVLEKVVELPVTRWNYRAESPEVEHLGPMAEDFHAAFVLGADDEHIASLDVGGVSLVAIQALEERTRNQEQDLEKQARTIEALRSKNAEQSETIEELSDRMRRLEVVMEELVESEGQGGAQR